MRDGLEHQAMAGRAMRPVASCRPQASHVRPPCSFLDAPLDPSDARRGVDRPCLFSLSAAGILRSRPFMSFTLFFGYLTDDNVGRRLPPGIPSGGSLDAATLSVCPDQSASRSTCRPRR